MQFFHRIKIRRETSAGSLLPALVSPCAADGQGPSANQGSAAPPVGEQGLSRGPVAVLALAVRMVAPFGLGWNFYPCTTPKNTPYTLGGKGKRKQYKENMGNKGSENL